MTSITRCFVVDKASSIIVYSNPSNRGCHRIQIVSVWTAKFGVVCDFFKIKIYNDKHSKYSISTNSICIKMCHSRSYHSIGIVPYFESQIRFGSIFLFFVFFIF